MVLRKVYIYISFDFFFLEKINKIKKENSLNISVARTFFHIYRNIYIPTNIGDFCDIIYYIEVKIILYYIFLYIYNTFILCSIPILDLFSIKISHAVQAIYNNETMQTLYCIYKYTKEKKINQNKIIIFHQQKC